MVTITENTPKREMNRLLKELVGKPVKVVAKDHFTITKLNESIKDPRFRQFCESTASFVVLGILFEVKDDYITLLSSWVIWQEEVKADEVHKIILNDLVQLKSLNQES